jgi:pyrroloquinoline quinone biosynthesis protein D
MTPGPTFRWPVLVRHARYRWDRLRRQHQLVYPEGVLMLNETGAAIVRLCDGRALGDLIDALTEQFGEGDLAGNVQDFLERLAIKGLIRDAADS